MVSKKAIERGAERLLSCFYCKKKIDKRRFNAVGRLCSTCQKRMESRPGQKADLGHGWSIQKKS